MTILNSLTDTELMLSVKDGNINKLGLLYERYKTWVYNFFLQMNSDRDLSEDMVQNVFMRILKYKHTYTEESKFVTWMFQIARNVSHDHFRKNAKNREHVDLDGVAFKIGGVEDVEASMEQAEAKIQLHKALQKLSIDKREVIVLSKLKELKYKEVGTILGCTEEAARTKAHRALKELKLAYFSLQQ